MTSAQGYPDGPIHELFERQVERTPDRVALIEGSEQITFAELNARANHVAHCLLEHGVERETFVGLCLERSLEAIVALIGILKAGGAYVYLDPGYPPRRLREMAQDAGLRLVFTSDPLRRRIFENAEGIRFLNEQAGKNSRVENPGSRRIGLDNASYVIYTSGSTGRPKGAVQVHGSMTSRLISAPLPDIQPTDVCCLNSSLSFGISASRLFFPLVQGAAVVLLRDEVVKDVHRFVDALDAYKVTSVFMVPALLRQVLAVADGTGRLGTLRAVSVSGGTLTPDLVDRFRRVLPETLLINTYGSTEIGTAAAMRVIDSTVSIGRPTPNTNIYIVDGDLNPVAAGVTGEICVATKHLAREYLNRPDLTAERFITIRAERMCRTGDLGRYLPNGDIEFLGRADHQVKIRGYRIELGEIEAVLLSHPSVEEAVAVARGADDERRLVAYIVSAAPPSAAELRQFVAERLPEHMVPAVYVMLPELPLTDAGKVDRNALPEPVQTSAGTTDGSPETETEKILAQIWSEVLKVDGITVHHNFIELGGDSLGATQLLAAIRGRFGVEIPARVLFDGTLAELARAVRS